jgi:hypothetical protein
LTEIIVSWANTGQTIVLCTYPVYGWTQEDSFKAIAQQRAMIESSPADIVDVIVDSRQITWLPMKLSFRKGLDKVAQLKHPRQGITVFVVSSGILASMAKVLLSLIDRHGREYFFVTTMDEALEKVAQVSARRQENTG